MFSWDLFKKRERHGGLVDQMSDRMFLLVLGFYVVGGLFCSAVVAALTYTWVIPNIWVVFAIGLGLPILGIIISFASHDWIISTLGYALVFIPFGALVGPLVALYELPSVVQVLIITMLVSAGMWAIGLIVPPITKDWGIYIIGALLVLIMSDLSRIAMLAFGFQPAVLQWFDYAAVVLFSGLIVYDVNRAMQRPKTMDMAVDSAVGIYLDILNLFLRLLRILGTKKAK